MNNFTVKDILGQEWVLVPVRADQEMSAAAADYAKRQELISGDKDDDYKALAWDICAGHRAMMAARPAFTPGPDLIEQVARGICRQRIEQNLRLDGKTATEEKMNVYIDAGWRNFIEEARYSIGGLFGVTPAPL